MKTSLQDKLRTEDFLQKSSAGLAVASFIIMTPFVVNNFIQGRILLGLGSFFIIVAMLVNAWSIITHKKFYSTLLLVILVPAIIYFLILAIQELGTIGILWCYPALIAFYFIMHEREAWIANILLLLVVSPMAWNFFKEPLAIRIIATLITTSIFSAVFIRVITRQQSRLHEMAITDPLTGLLNRMTLQTSLEQAIQQFQRTRIPMSLLAIDLDYFKKINDQFGHDTGDRVLKEIGLLLRKRCRGVDKVFRLGGEEFLVLLFNGDAKNISVVAEDILKSVTELDISPGIMVTASIGIATLNEDEDWKAWLKRSDQNLYLAKQQGRNRFVD